jgi:hypothetical protein
VRDVRVHRPGLSIQIKSPKIICPPERLASGRRVSCSANLATNRLPGQQVGPCPYARCGGRHFRLHQVVAKSVRDRVLRAATARRYECLRCRRTFRVHQTGMKRAPTSLRVKGLAVMLHLLGLSYGAVALALEALGAYVSKSQVADAVQAAAKRAPGLKWRQVFAGVQTPALGADITSVTCRGKWLPLGLRVDGLSGLVLRLDRLPNEEAQTSQTWLARTPARTASAGCHDAGDRTVGERRCGCLQVGGGPTRVGPASVQGSRCAQHRWPGRKYPARLGGEPDPLVGEHERRRDPSPRARLDRIARAPARRLRSRLHPADPTRGTSQPPFATDRSAWTSNVRLGTQLARSPDPMDWRAFSPASPTCPG